MYKKANDHKWPEASIYLMPLLRSLLLGSEDKLYGRVEYALRPDCYYKSSSPLRIMPSGEHPPFVAGSGIRVDASGPAWVEGHVMIGWYFGWTRGERGRTGVH